EGPARARRAPGPEGHLGHGHRARRRACAPPPHQARPLPAGRSQPLQSGRAHRADSERMDGRRRGRAAARRDERDPRKKKQGVTKETSEEAPPEYGQTEPQPQPFADNRDSYWWEGGQKVQTGGSFQ